MRSTSPPPLNKYVVGFIVAVAVLALVALLAGVNLIPGPAAENTPAVNLATLQVEAKTPGNPATLAALRQAQIPTARWADIAARLEGKPNVPDTLASPAPQLKIGDQQNFWVSNDLTSKHLQVQASLAFISPHLYFWVQNGLYPSQASLQTVGNTFENKIYPADRALFGSEWSPGIDNDVHLYILFSSGPSSHSGAYFSSEDEINPVIDPYSNAHEMFVVNADIYPQLNTGVLGVLAHEFQHMIAYNQHRDMEGWMNEGLAVVGTYINGYGAGSYDTHFVPNPDTQLNDFPNNPNLVIPHYGAAFLYLDYLLSRYGEDAIRQLEKNPANGLEGVDAVLTGLGAKDAATGQPVSADDLFADWTAANYLGDAAAGDGRYAYSNYAGVPTVQPTETISRCPLANETHAVHQYGADYLRIVCRGNFTLTFQGSQNVAVLPVEPHSGSHYFWSNKGDESDMTLTHAFDFSSVSGALTLTYWNWYDLEVNYDYVYLEASSDGQTWQILKTSSGTTDNPGHNNLGIGYNGTSRGWLKETVDLAAYAGKKVQLRFEYLTDDEVYGEGYLLDDVSIPQIGYATDFEADDGGWSANGFVRIQNSLPQTYLVSLIDLGTPKTVTRLTLSADQALSLPLTLNNDVVLVVSGTTRYTRQRADYSISIK